LKFLWLDSDAPRSCNGRYPCSLTRRYLFESFATENPESQEIHVFFQTPNAVLDKQTSLAVQDSEHVVLSVARWVSDWYFDTQSAKVVVPPYPPSAQGLVDEITRTWLYLVAFAYCDMYNEWVGKHWASRAPMLCGFCFIKSWTTPSDEYKHAKCNGSTPCLLLNTRANGFPSSKGLMPCFGALHLHSKRQERASLGIALLTQDSGVTTF
jgi:hypothetical protein